jgi:hypothetical protein
LVSVFFSVFSAAGFSAFSAFFAAFFSVLGASALAGSSARAMPEKASNAKADRASAIFFMSFSPVNIYSATSVTAVHWSFAERVPDPCPGRES